jgi:hypothetical protein
MLGALKAEQAPIVPLLVTAIAEMVHEIDPEGKRDHRSHWDTALVARRAKVDLFDRVRFAGDELVVLATQLAHCDELDVFVVLVMREDDPLTRLERDVPAVQLQRRWYPDLRAASLPVTVKAMRKQHLAALAVVDLLGKLAA